MNNENIIEYSSFEKKMNIRVGRKVYNSYYDETSYSKDYTSIDFGSEDLELDEVNFRTKKFIVNEVDLEGRINHLQEKIEDSEKKIDRLETLLAEAIEMIKYQPGGDEYKKAEEDFNKLMVK